MRQPDHALGWNEGSDQNFILFARQRIERAQGAFDSPGVAIKG
jgi:hypothetical protein